MYHILYRLSRTLASFEGGDPHLAVASSALSSLAPIPLIILEYRPSMAINITSPLSGATVSGTVSLTGTQGGVTVTASTGATQVVQQPLPFSFSIDTTTLTNGANTLSVNDGVSTASVPVIVSNAATLPASTLTVATPTTTTANLTLTGVAGSTWVNVAAWDNVSGTKVSSDVAPVSNAFSIPVNLGTLTGARTLNVIAFSVPAGQSGGTSSTVSVSYTVAVVAPPAPTVDLFWGADIHPVQGGIYTSRSVAQQKADALNIGLTTVCADAYTIADCNTLAALIPQWAPITLVPELIPVQGTLSGSTTTMYNNMKTFGAQAAAVLAGCPLVVFGNEDDLVSITNNAGTDGNLPSQYNATQTGLYLAAYSGFCDGWHSVDTNRTTKLAINGVYIHTGWLQMLVNGTLPNGTAAPHGAPDVDAYTWHDYQTGGDPAATSGHSGVVNLFNAIAALTNKPIYLSETGKGDPGVSSSAVSSYINTIFPEVLAHSQWKGVWYYEMYDYSDGAYGLLDANGNIKSEGTTLKNFIAANPK